MMNRFMAVLVLIAAGMLIFPFFGSHPRDGLASLSTDMIKAPPFPNQQAQNETIQAIHDQATSRAGSMKISKTLAEIAVVSKNYKIKNHTKTNAWVIQIGPSKDKVTALRLVNQLRAKGYNAFIYQKGAAFGEQVTVFIGPEVKRNLAEGLATKLAQETRLSTTVKSYKPLTA